MEIDYKNNNIQKYCEIPNRVKKDFGLKNQEKFDRRMLELFSAETLQHIHQVPGTGFHSLSGKKDGCYAVDLHGRTRLVFRPIGDDFDLGDLRTVKAIQIEDIVDYH